MSAPVPLNSGCCAPSCPDNPQTAVPGPAGENAFSFTTGNFTQPAVGSNVTVGLTHTGWLAQGQVVFVQGGGYYQVITVSGLNVTLNNLGNNGNANPGATVNSGAKVGPGGTGGTTGNAFTTTSANFTQPAVNGTVNVQVVNSAWAVVGQYVFVSAGGTYTVFAVPDATHITLTNLGYSANAVPTTVIASPQGVSPAGPQGPQGASGVSTLNQISPTTTKGDLIVDNGANNPAASDVRVGVGTNGKALVADSTQAAGVNYATITPNTAATSGDIAVFNGTTGTPMALKDSKLLINANGAIQSTPSGGNARGVDAIDLQVDRAAGTQVASGNNSVLSGGVDNTASGTQSTCSGGLACTASGTQSSVGGGSVNTASATAATVAGGQACTASQTSATVSGGNTNTASGQGSTVVGGETNTASALDSTVLGGVNNSATGVNAIAHGAYALANKRGQITFGSDFNTTPGGAQFSVFLVMAQTTGASNAEMTLDLGGTQFLVLPTNVVWGFDGIIVAKYIGTPAACAVWTVSGGIKNAAGVVSLVGSPTVTQIAKDGGFSGTPALTASADVGNVALDLQVAGVIAANIVWFGTIRVTELFSN